MALIAANTPGAQVGEFLVTRTLTTGADTLEYKQSVKQVLYIHNESASPAAIVVDGDTVTTVNLPGQGALTNNAAGYTINVAAGAVRAVELSKIRNYLKGVVNVTGGGADIYAWVHES